jgi:hypothetical protein
MARLRDGTLVRHRIKGYIGTIFGVTRMKELFELPTDPIGYRVKPFTRLAQDVFIASPDNIETLENMTLEDRHRANALFLGFEWKGTRRRIIDDSNRPSRVSYCWFCKLKINNTVDLECIACGWILCNCGACGCGYKM